MPGFVLILNGPPDAMQPRVVKALMQKPGRFHVSTNKVKFCISDHSALTTRRDMLNHIVFDLAGSACKEGGYSLIVDGSVSIQRRWWTAYMSLAIEMQVAFLQVNLEGPYEVLLRRFQERVAKSEEDGTKISIRTEAEFKERYDAYHSLKDSQLPTFHTDIWTPAQIAEEIEKLLAQ